MASFTGSGVFRWLSLFIIRKECPDETIESKLGEQWDKLLEYGRAHVEGTSEHESVTQTITLTIKVKTYRTKNEEMAIDVTPLIKGVVPNVPLPTKTFFIDRDGVAHTVSVQDEFPIVGISPRAIEGGKQDNAAKPAAKVV